MLILTRKPGAQILITVGDVEIVLTVTRLAQGKAWLGFESSKRVVIDRMEVALDKIAQKALEVAALNATVQQPVTEVAEIREVAE